MKNKGNDAAEELADGEMPPWFYVLGHPEAKLSASEKAELIKGLKATFNVHELEQGRKLRVRHNLKLLEIS